MRKEEVDKEYKIEHSHWWYAGTREICFDLMDRHIFKAHGEKSYKILDIGCGTGGNLEVFRKFGDARGIDCDGHSINYCHEKGLDASKGTMQELSFAEGSFDLVSFFDVLNQIPLSDQPDVLRGVCAVIAAGGYVVLREPALNVFSGRHDREVGIQKRYTRRDMGTLLERAGFKIIYRSYINFFLALPILIKRKLDFARDTTPRSDVVETTALLNSLFLAILRLEKMLLRVMTFPFGVSLFVIARKKESPTPGNISSPSAS